MTFAFVFDVPTHTYLDKVKAAFKPEGSIFSRRQNIHFDMVSPDLGSYEFSVWIYQGIVAKVWGKIEPVGLNQSEVTGEIILEIPLMALVAFSIFAGIFLLYGIFAPSIPILIFGFIWIAAMAFSLSQARQRLLRKILENLDYQHIQAKAV